MADTRERPDVDGWYLTRHLRERMGQRQVSRQDIEACLLRPQVTMPDPKGDPNVRYLRHGSYFVVADVVQRVAFTVNIDGTSADDWRELEDRAIAVGQETALAAPQRRPRPAKQAVAAHTSTHPLDGVHPRIRDTIERELAGRWHEYVIRVLSPVSVTYWRKDNH